MNIVVLGGAGLMGRYAVRDLVLNPEVDQVTIADLDVNLASQVASILDSPKVNVQPADATDRVSLVSALSGAAGYLFPAVRDAEQILPDHDALDAARDGQPTGY